MNKVKLVIIEEGTGDTVTRKEVTVPVPVIRTQFNSRFFVRQGEVNNMPSMTVPNQAMSVYEIMKRYASGLPLDSRVPIYDGDTATTDLQKLDLAERQAVLQEAREEIRAINERVKKRRDDAKQAHLEKIVERRLQEKIDAKAKLEELQKKVGNNE